MKRITFDCVSTFGLTVLKRQLAQMPMKLLYSRLYLHRWHDNFNIQTSNSMFIHDGHHNSLECKYQMLYIACHKKVLKKHVQLMPPVLRQSHFMFYLTFLALITLQFVSITGVILTDATKLLLNYIHKWYAL